MQNQVLSLYSAKMPFSLESEVEAKLKIFPNSPPAEFVLKGIEEYCNLYSGSLKFKERNRRSAILKNSRLDGEVLKLDLNLADLARIFFGYHTSEKLFSAFRGFSEKDDERTQQILGYLRRLDGEVNYVYSYGEYLVVEKDKYKDLVKKLPRDFFEEGMPIRVPKSRWHGEGDFHPSKEGRYVYTPKFKRGRNWHSSEKKSLSYHGANLLEGDVKFLALFPRRNYRFRKIGQQEPFPPRDLGYIDFFPYQREYYRQCFESSPHEDDRTPEDYLVKKINSILKEK